MKGKNKMKTIEVKECMLRTYGRMDELVKAIQIINDGSFEKRLNDKSDMSKFVISILCNELNELIENLKNKL